MTGINPYVTDALVPSRLFFGRERTLGQINGLITARPMRTIAIAGVPRFGASSLLRMIASPENLRRFPEPPDRYLLVWIDLSSELIESPADLCAVLIRRAAYAANAPLPAELACDLDSLNAQLMALRGERRLVLLLDELQLLARPHLGATFAVVNGLRERDVGLVATLTDTPERLAGYSSPPDPNLLALFDETIYPPLLELQDARMLIQVPARDAGVTIPEMHADYVYSLAGGHPYLLMLGAKHLFELLHEHPVFDEAARARLHRRLADTARGYFGDLWSLLAPEDRRVLTALARGKAPPRGTGRVLRRLRNLRLVIDADDPNVLFCTLFTEFVQQVAEGAIEPEQISRPREDAPRCTLALICDDTGRDVTVELRGRLSLLWPCYEPLARNLASYAGRARDVARSSNWRAGLHTIGADLYENLFQRHDELTEAYQRALGAVSERLLALRFKGPRDFIGMPFEMLRDEQGNALALRHPISRMITGQLCDRQPPGTELFERLKQAGDECRALVVSANVSGELEINGRLHLLPELRNADSEVVRVARSLTDQGWHCEQITTRDLHRDLLVELLRDCPFHLFHFSGHGHYNAFQPDHSGLVVPDAEGNPTLLDVRELRGLLQDRRTTRLALAYLSCCEGAAVADASRVVDNDALGVIDGLVSAGVPAVIGYRWPIGDEAAMQLASLFYDKLHRLERIDEVLLYARQEIERVRNDLSWAAPILVMQE